MTTTKDGLTREDVARMQALTPLERYNEMPTALAIFDMYSDLLDQLAAEKAETARLRAALEEKDEALERIIEARMPGEARKLARAARVKE